MNSVVPSLSAKPHPIRRTPTTSSGILLAFGALAVFGLSGCRGLPTFRTTSHVTTEIPPVVNAGRVAPHNLQGRCAANVERIAILDVDGVLLNMDMTGMYSLGENPVSLFREKLDRAAADPCVRGIVLRINSPGGGVTACDMMRHDLASFRSRTGIPVVACFLDVGAGGAYYLATAADVIVAHPTTVTGGIGVILNVYNLKDTLNQFNVQAAPVKSGPNIDLGSPIEPLTEEARELLESMAREFHDRFKRAVRETRPRTASDRVENLDGRVFTGPEAMAQGLIDEIGYLDDAITIARVMGKAPRAEVAFYHRGNDPARSPYAVTPNVPLQTSLIPLSIPGLDRGRLPTFLYMWQPNPALEKAGGY